MNTSNAQRTIWTLTRKAHERLEQQLHDHSNLTTRGGPSKYRQDPLNAAMKRVELTTLQRITAAKKLKGIIETDEERWNRREKWEQRPKLKRRIPMSKDPLPYLSLKNKRDQKVCAHWFFGKFPVQQDHRIYSLRHGEEAAARWKERMYYLMSRTKWTKEEKREVEGQIQKHYEAKTEAQEDEIEAAFQAEIDEDQQYI